LIIILYVRINAGSKSYSVQAEKKIERERDDDDDEIEELSFWEMFAKKRNNCVCVPLEARWAVPTRECFVCRKNSKNDSLCLSHMCTRDDGLVYSIFTMITLKQCTHAKKNLILCVHKRRIDVYTKYIWNKNVRSGLEATKQAMIVWRRKKKRTWEIST
jgi:hypothetical protein